MKKRLLSIILAVSMMATMIPGTVFAEAEEPGIEIAAVEDKIEEATVPADGESEEEVILSETISSQETVSETAEEELCETMELPLSREVNPFTIQSLQLKNTPYHYGEKLQPRLKLGGPVSNITSVIVVFDGSGNCRQELTYDTYSGYFIGDGYTLEPSAMEPGSHCIQEVCITAGGQTYYITDPKGERHGDDDGSYNFTAYPFEIANPAIANPYSISWFRINGEFFNYGDIVRFEVKLDGPAGADTEVCVGIGAEQGIPCTYDSAKGIFVAEAATNNAHFPHFGMYTVHWVQIRENDGDTFRILNTDEDMTDGFTWNYGGNYDFTDYTFELDGSALMNPYGITGIQITNTSLSGGDTLEAYVKLGGPVGEDTKVILLTDDGMRLPAAYDSLVGSYISSVKINNTWQSGTRQIVGVQVQDPAGNRFLMGEEAYDFSGCVFTVANTQVAPKYEITGLTINRLQFRYRDSMEFKVKVSGTVSGISDLTLTFAAGSLTGPVVHCTYDSGKDAFLGTVSVNNSWRPGRYTFSDLTIVDTKGNRFSMADSALSAGGSGIIFNIIDEYVDPSKAYVVTFDGNGADRGGMNDLVCSLDVRGEIPFCDYSRKGYTFKGWNIKKDGSGQTYAPGATFLNLSGATGKTVTLYAQWTPRKYTLQYSGNGSTSGSMKAKTDCVYNTTYTLTANAFKRTGYTFQGWSTTANGPVKYENKAKVKNLIEMESSVTLYAVWKQNTYQIQFKGNGGKVDDASSYKQAMTYGEKQALTENRFIRPGYTFLGWNSSSKAKEPTYKDKEEKVFNLTATNGATVSLNAIWKANPYTIHFESNFPVDGGTGSMADVPMTYGVKKALPANTFACPGYRFGGWECDNGKTYSNKAKVSNLVTEGTVTLKVKWLANNYSVAFKLNGGKTPEGSSGVFDTQSGLNLENDGLMIPKVAPVYTNTAYKFIGWNTAADGSGKHYDAGAKGIQFTATKNKQKFTLYAESVYTLILDGNMDDGSIEPTEKQLKYGEYLTLTDCNMKRTGYSLAGWNTNPTKAKAGTVQYKIGAKVKNLGGKKLYAVWKKK